MQRLNAMDTSFVYGETATWHMHAGSLVVVDPTTAPDGFDVDRVRGLVRARAGLLGPFLRRLVEVPLGLDRPAWIAVSDVEVETQVRQAVVPAPGGPRQLGDLVGELFAVQLPRNRPLWELWYIDGLRDGRVALLVKIHHALVDGTRSARLFELLFDLAPDAPVERPGTPALHGERMPSGVEMALRSAPRLATTPLRLARTVGHLGGAALRMARLPRSSGSAAATLPFQAPRTSLNRTITARRGFAFCSVPVAEVKAIKDAFAVTVNDVVLGLCAGALRRYLDDRNELPDRPLVAQIPVAVHVGQDAVAGEWGNAVMVMGAALGTDVPDPGDRLRAISASTHSAKAMQRALGDDLIFDLAGLVPPGVLAAGVRAYTRMRLSEHHPPIFNLILSNVRGPSIALYVAGARLEAVYPIGPLLDGGGLNITVMSYLDSVDFGFAVCPDVVEDPWLLADATLDAHRELVDAARAVDRARRAGARSPRRPHAPPPEPRRTRSGP